MKLIVIIGPTGVGKTKLSVSLAKKFNGEIINADSTQVYQGMNIGTAKIKEEEKENVPHHLFDFKSLDEEYTVYDYQKDARNKIEQLCVAGKTPIIVGGSGLYLTALLYDYHFQEGNNIYDVDALSDQEMYDELMKLHPELEIDKHNRQRLIRAYAKYRNQSESITKDQGGENLLYDCHVIGLAAPRDILYDRLNKRAEEMIEEGLIQEARFLYQNYPTSRQLHTTICYKEMIRYIDKEISLEDAVSLIKKNCRNYAKRQITWFNHKMDVKWFSVNFSDFDKTIDEVSSYITK